jgi:hypothetical protein
MIRAASSNERMPAWEGLHDGQGRLSRAVTRILVAIAAAATAVSVQLRAALALGVCALWRARPLLAKGDRSPAVPEAARGAGRLKAGEAAGR